MKLRSGGGVTVAEEGDAAGRGGGRRGWTRRRATRLDAEEGDAAGRGEQRLRATIES